MMSDARVAELKAQRLIWMREAERQCARVAELEADLDRALDALREHAAFIGDEQHPDWTAYVATNLREALKLVPDTGDWYWALRTWCDQHAGDKLKPNRTAEDQHAALRSKEEER